MRANRSSRAPSGSLFWKPGNFSADEASKWTEDQSWSRTPVRGFGWQVAYRAGRRGTDMTGAFALIE
jgi:hypothetical protein